VATVQPAPHRDADARPDALPRLVAVQVADLPTMVLVPVWRAAADNDGMHAFAAVASSLRRANDQSK
jgi:hypothetical protein